MTGDTVQVNQPRAAAPRVMRGRVRQYELIREIGHGGMGTVYLARDTKLARLVAIKFLADASRTVGERFLVEARATARCVHENIVVIHEVDELEGQPYMVLEYLEGRTLRTLIDAAHLSPARAVELIVPVVRALACAHELGVVHRDLKPENIFVTQAGQVKVLDFGIAKVLDEISAQPTHDNNADIATTGASALVGTQLYMSPEQWGADEVDTRTDLWAVGLLLFELIAGKHPLAPATRDKLMDAALRLGEEMPTLASVGVTVERELEAVIARCLAKRKADRFASANELCSWLEPHLPRRQTSSAREVQPYIGLAAFREEDADLFHGRSAEVARLMTSLEERPLVAVVGASGAGKSSLVRAGLVPALKRRESWDIAITRPGRHPLDALATSALAIGSGATQRADDPGADELAAKLATEPGVLGELLRRRARARNSHVLLFVDQFEELYTLADDATVRRAYLASLRGAADDPLSPVRVVLSMRSDFLDRVAQDPELVDAITAGIQFVAQTDGNSLRAALVEPARHAGYRFESDELVEEMLTELASTAGALPLLQFAASRLWQERDTRQRLLTREAYRRIGGVAGALASHADAVIAGLAPAAQDLARRLVLRLVTPERTRDVVEVTELTELGADRDAVRKVLDHLVAARLVAVRSGTGPATVELVHESLIARWPALRSWLDQTQEHAAFLARLRTATRQWEDAARSADLLWRGEPERDARRWSTAYTGELGTREREYLDAVFRQADRAVRTPRIAVAGTIGGLALLVVAAAVALLWIRDAESEAVREANRARAEAEKATEANQKLREEHERQAQLVEKLEAETAAREAARAAATQAAEQVTQSRTALEQTNVQLEASVVRAETESQRARTESQRAKAESERARTEAERALAAQRIADEQRRRAEDLARKERERVEKRGRINTSLP